MLSTSTLFTEIGIAFVAILIVITLVIVLFWRNPYARTHLASIFKSLFEKSPDLGRAERIRWAVELMLADHGNVVLVFGWYGFSRPDAGFVVVNEPSADAGRRIIVCFPNTVPNPDRTVDVIRSCCRRLEMNFTQRPASKFADNIGQYLQVATAGGPADRRIVSLLKNATEISEVECGDNIDGAIDLIECFGKGMLPDEEERHFSVVPLITGESGLHPKEYWSGGWFNLALRMGRVGLAASILLTATAELLQITPSWHMAETVVAGLVLQVKTLDIALIVLVLLGITKYWRRSYWLWQQLEGKVDVGNEIPRGRELIRRFFWPMITKTLLNYGVLLIILTVISWIRF